VLEKSDVEFECADGSVAAQQIGNVRNEGLLPEAGSDGLTCFEVVEVSGV
jgi:hypothetical protein